MMFDTKYTGVVQIDEDKVRHHKENMFLRCMEEDPYQLQPPPTITIFVGEDKFVENSHFLEAWSPEFKKQSHDNEIDLREFDGNLNSHHISL